MNERKVIVRLADPEFGRLKELLFSRYPELEWATFARLGWRQTPNALVLTLAALDPPSGGDLDESVGHVKILEPYSLRIALAAETHPLAVGVVHSHPRGCAPQPSTIDDDMDGYYSAYFGDFARGRPYVSLIVSEDGGRLVMSGRVYWEGVWHAVDRFITEGVPVETWNDGLHVGDTEDALRGRTARFTAAFGEEASERLRRATVAVIGAGGTGSMAIEVLARAGVGRLVVIDPDHVTESNLERVHGSQPEHAERQTPKVLLAREHVRSINPQCEVEAYLGSLPQKEALDAVVRSDVALGCTDQQHSRLALSDITFRYLVPAIDCGVMLEGGGGTVTGQIIQFVRFLASDSCVLCRGMVTPERLSEELMPEEEKARRRAEAEAARLRGDDPGPYWHGTAQLNTVGYLTGAAGALAAAYAIGWITGRFNPPFSRAQMNLVAEYFDVQDIPQQACEDCACRRRRGWADQGAADALISAPGHWPAIKAFVE
jgi:molybdopterin/thiamine biosynthesis adenylyltransferase